MSCNDSILIVVHPGSACAEADRRMGERAAPARDEIAREILGWGRDMLIVEDAGSHNLQTYALLGIAVDAATELPGRRCVRHAACPAADPRWVETVVEVVDAHWPEAVRSLVITGAWCGDGDETIDALVTRLADRRVSISASAMRAT